MVVDNTSYWRMHEDVPLVVAGVNDDAVADHNGLVANPNCTTMELMVALKPILDAAGIERLIVSTYQSVSGTGREAISELREQSEAVLKGKKVEAKVYPHQVAFNVAAPGRDLQGRRRLHDRGAQGDGGDAQDPRPLRGGRDLGDLRPRAGGHRPLRVGQRPDGAGPLARGVPRSCSPRPRAWSSSTIRATASTRCRSRPPGRDEVLVGRIRRDPSHERCLNLWVVGDNLRKGAATNAVQVAELLHQRDLVRVPAGASLG